MPWVGLLLLLLAPLLLVLVLCVLHKGSRLGWLTQGLLLKGLQGAEASVKRHSSEGMLERLLQRFLPHLVQALP